MNIAINGIISSMFFHPIEFVYSVQIVWLTHAYTHTPRSHASQFHQVMLASFSLIYYRAESACLNDLLIDFFSTSSSNLVPNISFFSQICPHSNRRCNKTKIACKQLQSGLLWVVRNSQIHTGYPKLWINNENVVINDKPKPH